MTQRDQENVGVCSSSMDMPSGKTMLANCLLNGVHNHEMVPYVVGHLFAGRLMEDDKKIVHD